MKISKFCLLQTHYYTVYKCFGILVFIPKTATLFTLTLTKPQYSQRNFASLHTVKVITFMKDCFLIFFFV